MTLFKKSLFAALCAALVLGFSLPCPRAQAQEGDSARMPSGRDAMDADAGGFPGEETHPPLRLTPDRSEILTMDENVGRVVIGNETHLNILMDTTKRLVIVPRIPGATYFTILGENGKILMQRYAIIAAPEEKYVRIRQPCQGEDRCMPIRMFYCPDMCHEIGIAGEGNNSFSASMPMLSKDERAGGDKNSDKNDTGNDTGNDSSSEGEQ